MRESEVSQDDDPPGSGSPYVRALARGGTAGVAGALVSALGGFAVVLLVSRGYPKEVAGSLFATTSLFLIVVTLVQLGADAGLPRWIPLHLVDARPDRAAMALVVALTPTVLVSVAVAIVGFVSAPRLGPLLAGEANASLATSQLRVLSVLLPVAALAGVLLAASRGYGSMRPTVLADRIGVTSLQALGILLALALDADASWLVVVWSLPYAASLALSVWWLLRRRGPIRRSLGGRDPRPRPAGPAATWTSVGRQYWAFTWPRAIVSLSQVALRRLDVVLVAALVSAADAAVYTAATRFVVVAGLGVLGIQQALAPQLSRAFAQGHRSTAQQLLHLSTAWMMLISWPVYLVVMAGAPELLAIFGPGYAAGAVVVVIGSLGMLYGTSAGAVDTALVMSGHSVLSMLNSVAVLVLNVVLNLLLIPTYGITGAAVAWAATVVVRNILAQVQVKRLDGLRLYGVASVWAAACVLAVYAPALLALRLWGSAPLVVSIAVIVVSTAIYAWTTFRVPALHLDDLVRSITRDRWGRSVATAEHGRREDDHGAQR